MHWKNSLKWQTFLRIIWIYGLTTICLGCVQLWFDYQREINILQEQLRNAQDMFGSQIGMAYYNADDDQLDTIFEGVLANPFLTGVAIFDDRTEQNRSKGQLPCAVEQLAPYASDKEGFVAVNSSGSLGYQKILYIINAVGVKEKFGHLFFFSNYSIIYEHLRGALLIVFGNSLINGGVLLAVFSLVFHSSVLRPLERFANAINQARIDSPEPIKSELSSTQKNELTELEERFDTLLKELHAAHKNLQTLNAMKTSLLSSVSHELRTPLTSLYGLAKLSKKKVQGMLLPLTTQAGNPQEQKACSQVQNNLDTMITQGEHLEHLIEQVMKLSRLLSGDTNLHLTCMRLEDIIKQVLQTAQKSEEHQATRLRTEIPENLPCVHADSALLTQALNALVSNAMKFAPENEITIRAKNDNHFLTISVTDRGPGITQEEQTKVFEAFTQAGEVLSEKPQGLGLGLTLCKTIVELHNGRITLESTYGKGSTFNVLLPTCNTITKS